MNGWLMLALFAWGIVVTGGTSWIVLGYRRNDLRGLAGLSRLAADMIWAAIVFAGGVLAARYVERIPVAAIGWLGFGALSLALSLARAALYHRGTLRRPAEQEQQMQVRFVLHQLAYVLFAAAAYMVLEFIAGGTVQLILLVPLWLGALLPDLDSQTSPLGRLLPFVSRRVEDRFGHRSEWHSLGVNALVAAATVPLAALLGVEAWALLSLGFLTHIVLDLLSSRGCMFFWPATRRVFTLAGRGLDTSRPGAERALTVALAFAVALLLLVVDVGPPPPPVPPAPPTFAASMDRYQAIRGRNLAFADVVGTWQATGRPVSGRYEILSAAGQTLVLLDRFSGQVFTAGQEASDNLYVRKLSLVAGEPVRVKPVGIHLEAGSLDRALPVLYQMQAEAGLQHIFVSGDIVGPEPELEPDFSQTALRRVQVLEPGHYLVQYLSAAELIALADVQVGTADLVIVATYLVAPQEAEPTVTSLPSPET